MHKSLLALAVILLFSGWANAENGQNANKWVYSVDQQGGDSGPIVKVTNLNAKGQGSLRWAIEQKGARRVVFEVGGVINLDKSSLKIREPFISILGETAPSPGITLIQGGIRIETHHVKLSHLMVRPGDAGQVKGSGWKPDGITVYGENARHVVIDHCSVTWAVDENMAVSGPRDLGPHKTSGNVVIKNSIIAEALHDSTHPEGPHSKGLLIHNNAQNISVLNNLFAHNNRRNPYFKTNTKGVFKGNIIYNPGKRAIHLSSSDEDFYLANPEVSIVGNVMISGVDTKSNLSLVSNYGLAYLFDNHIYGKNRTLWDIPGEASPSATVFDADVDLSISDIKTDFCTVLSSVGARPWDPSAIDVRIKKAVLSKTGKLINSQSEVGGYPSYIPTYKTFESGALGETPKPVKQVCSDAIKQLSKMAQ